MEKNQSSSTALTVLQGLVFTGKYSNLNFLVSQENLDLAIKILNSTEDGKKKLKNLESKFFRYFIIPFADKFIMKGITSHYALRKKFIEEETISHIKKYNITQVVNLGAGFDTLLIRKSKEFQDIDFYEVDHPATQNLKKKIVKKFDVPKNLKFISVDFENEKIINKLKIDENKNTLFIIEGVLMYLEKADVLELCKEILAMTKSHFSIIFTFRVPQKAKFNILDLYLKLKHENIKSEINQQELQKLCSKNNLKMQKIIDSNFFKSNYLINYKKQIRLNESELIAVSVR
jgi:methyltransferase (TIGR00027 family)